MHTLLGSVMLLTSSAVLVSVALVVCSALAILALPGYLARSVLAALALQD